jgi:cation transport ATPase
MEACATLLIQVKMEAGEGILCTVENQVVLVGNRTFMKRNSIVISEVILV